MRCENCDILVEEKCAECKQDETEYWFDEDEKILKSVALVD